MPRTKSLKGSVAEKKLRVPGSCLMNGDDVFHLFIYFIIIYFILFYFINFYFLQFSALNGFNQFWRV